MTNWQDPQTLASNALAVVKLVHFVDGVYLWDWMMGLSYEYRLITRRKEWKWPMLIYFLCRFFTLVLIICDLVGFNVTSEINCVGIVRSATAFGYASLGLSSALITLRTIAIWRKNKIMTPFILALYATNIAFLIYGVAKGIDAFWDPVNRTCVEFNTVNNRLNIWATFISDITLLVIMLSGLWFYKGAGNLWKLVYYQGAIWFIVATICYIPPTVLITLNFNDSLNLLCQTPTSIAMAICTTRMQRNLSEYANSSSMPPAVVTRSMRFARRTTSHTENHAVIAMEHVLEGHSEDFDSSFNRDEGLKEGFALTEPV